MSKAEELEKLKAELGSSLISDPEKLKKPDGIPTGFKKLDEFLLWNGFPKGALTSLTGEPGLGATSLWLGAAAHVTQQKKWVAWIDEGNESQIGGTQLFPLHLWQKGLDLSKFVSIATPQTERKLLWLLQELMASGLFELIGCDLGQTRLRASQLRKLEKQARSFQVALVFFTKSEGKRAFPDQQRNLSLFSLAAKFEAGGIRVERALHRQTPYFIERRLSYDSFTATQHHRFSVDEPTTKTEPNTPAALRGLKPNPLLDSSQSIGPTAQHQPARRRRSFS